MCTGLTPDVVQILMTLFADVVQILMTLFADVVQILMTLFADDVLLASYCMAGLQMQFEAVLKLFSC